LKWSRTWIVRGIKNNFLIAWKFLYVIGSGGHIFCSYGSQEYLVSKIVCGASTHENTNTEDLMI
jgi:hypothetical protein